MGGLYFGLYSDFVKSFLIVNRRSSLIGLLDILTTILLYSVGQTVFAERCRGAEGTLQISGKRVRRIEHERPQFSKCQNLNPVFCSDARGSNNNPMIVEKNLIHLPQERLIRFLQFTRLCGGGRLTSLRNNSALD